MGNSDMGQELLGLSEDNLGVLKGRRKDFITNAMFNLPGQRQKPGRRAKVKTRPESDSDESKFSPSDNDVKPWKCKKCPDTFGTLRKLRNHRKDKHFRRKEDAQFNFIYKHNLGAYECSLCQSSTRVKEEMEAHVIGHSETYTCEDCGMMFQSAYKYSVHMQFHGSEHFSCPFCDFKTLRKTAILTHINTMHLKKFVYNCKFCGKGFEDVVKHIEHEKTHEGAEPITCIVCNKEFMYSRYLLTHQRRYHRVTIDGVPLPNQCHICRRTFSKPDTLIKHLVIHDRDAANGGKNHLCDVCGKGFTGKEKLDAHYRIHTGDKPYACSYCPKKFTKKEYLTMHERIHSGEKPFCCKYCGRGFNQAASLRIHVRGHTGERPYMCHICNTGYVSRGALNHHFKTCNG